MFLTDTLFGDLIGLVLALAVIFILYYKWSFQYWARRNVPYLEPQIPFGNVTDAIRGREHISVTFKKLYDEMKSRGWKHGGIYIFSKPNYFPIDLEIIRNIMTKDFQYFMDRDVFYNEKDALQAHLLNLTGGKWRSLRSKISPAFTSGKMKMMFNIMAECQGGLEKRLDQECLKNKPIDIKEVLACFTTNIIGSCAFGLEFNALEDENSKFRLIGKKMFDTPAFLRWKRTLAVTFPKVAKLLRLSMTRKDLVDFIMNMVVETIDYREKNNYVRNDFMQMMIEMKNKKLINEDDGLTMDELASQVAVFYGAGFETSSTLMTFAMYELSRNQDVQDKLRSEINEVLARHNNQMTYEAVQDMPYLNQVIDEALRIHPPGALTNRKCVKDYKVPNQDIVIEKGTTVTIPILGIHHDEEIYPNPLQFDPDRFSDENRKKRHNYAHLPFGEGPRNCIGMRFGILQSKMGLVALIRKYRFTLNKKTKQPLTYQPKNIVLAAEGEVWLDAKKL